ncbi:hypothetical protein QBC47DRAFT_381939 [Echria macrotheca]|uniref:Uncharacterized protein n=1 Tax=Echria macrotheca TaxID=438768 RepID=A0AAJ0BAT6_9PEZI|nr:hypothetical protein QBC47DRAFT_381939 [Echria macrotheca]
MIRMKSIPMPQPGEPVSSKPQLDPIPVTFGVGKIPIVDGPAALAYIFSVAQPPTYLSNPPADINPKPSLVRQWVLPLLAALSRCIYLAYIYEEIRGTEPYGGNKGNVMVVPLMSCAMWFVDDGQPAGLPHYLLGSTYVTGSNLGVAGVDALQKRRLMNAWRKETLLDPPLASFDPPRVVPPTTDPQFFMAPTLQEEVEKLLLGVLRSEALANADTGDLNRLLPETLALSLVETWATIDQTIVSAAVDVADKAMREPYEAIKPPLPPIDALPRDMILDNKKAALRTTLRQALSSVMRIVWGNLGVLPTQQDDINKLEAAFKELFSVYYVPHYYLVKPDPATQTSDLDFTAEVPIPTRLAAAEVLWTALWTTATRDNMFQMAHRIYWWVSAEEESLKFASGMKSRFGRCAETHPVLIVTQA